MQPPRILMLEEDPDDQQLTTSVLAEAGLSHSITFLRHSHELLKALEDGDRPSLILVDFNSSPATGLEVLRELKSNEAYRGIPVTILGEGLPPHLIRQCYEAGASSYITKPSSNKATREKIEIFFKYWLNVAETE